MIKGNIDCPCGCGLSLSQDIVRVIMNIAKVVKQRLDRDLIITSGARCKNYNLKIGGNKNSSHILGKAVDISTTDSVTRFLVLKTALDNGIKRIGWNKEKKFLHIDICSADDYMPYDIDKKYPQEVAFDY